MKKSWAFGHVREFDRAKVEETRYVEFIISNSATDRHNSVLNMKGWQLENYNENPIVGYQHEVYGGGWFTSSNPDNVLGPGRAYIEGDNLIGGVTFETKDINPLAEKIMRKVMNKTLRATSVGFLEVGEGETRKSKDDKGKDKELYYFEAQELLEYSIVHIPSNPKAVGRAMEDQLESFFAHLLQFMPQEMSMKDLKGMKIQTVLDYAAGKVEQKVVEEVLTNKKSIYERKLRLIDLQVKN